MPMIATSENATGYKAFRIGSLEVIALNDGLLEVPLSNFPLAAGERAEQLLAGGGAPSGKVPVQVNGFLVRTPRALVLIDAGAGTAITPAAGHLATHLAAAGYRPDQINRVLMTHLHIDHAGGLVEGDAAVFGNAELWLAEAELAYWRSPGFPDAAPERQKASSKAASRALELYRDRIRTFTPGAAISPEIHSVPLPGHTPGHTGFTLDGGEERLLVWGDIIHSALLQFAMPDWHYAADVDRDLAASTRLDMFARSTAETRLIAGMHLPFPGIGRVVGDAGAYEFSALSDGPT